MDYSVRQTIFYALIILVGTVSCIMFLGGWAFFVVGATVMGAVFATIEFCSPGKSSVVYRITPQNCPFGVLFKKPIPASCFLSNDPNRSDFLVDVCRNAIINESAVVQIHLMTQIDGGDLDDTCRGVDVGQCNVTHVVNVTSDLLTPPEELDNPILEALEETMDESTVPLLDNMVKDSLMIEQTRRMFKFLMGLTEIEQVSVKAPSQYIRFKRSPRMTSEELLGEEQIKWRKPRLRLTTLLEKTFKILKKHCDRRFVPDKFLNDILQAFLFLLTETDLSRVKDASREDFQSIILRLNICLDQDVAFKVNGTRCRGKSKVEYVQKGTDDEGFHYIPDETRAFHWGTYDMVVDAVWSAIRFTHGLCYGTFRELINSHHVYQRVMEALFTQEMLFRWINPPRLFDEALWENMFSTGSVQHSMRSLDACVSVAYMNTPFQHPLERPIQASIILPLIQPLAQHSTPSLMSTTANVSETGVSSRQRRDISKKKTTHVGESNTFDAKVLEGGGWCFQSPNERNKIVMRYIGLKCTSTDIMKDKHYKKTLHWLAG